MAKSGGFGLGKKIPGQGGMAKPNVAPSRHSDAPKGRGQSTPDLGRDHAKNTNIRPKPQGK